MLAIPYLTVDNEVVGIRFRTLDPDSQGPKYLGLPGAETTPYNLPALLRSTGTVIVAEGELDVVALTHLGYTAIGIPGASNWKPHYSRMLDSFDRVIVAGDPDDAGQKFNETIMASIRRATSMHLKQDINDTMLNPMGFAEIAQAFSRAGGQR